MTCKDCIAFNKSLHPKDDYENSVIILGDKSYQWDEFCRCHNRHNTYVLEKTMICDLFENRDKYK